MIIFQCDACKEQILDGRVWEVTTNPVYPIASDASRAIGGIKYHCCADCLPQFVKDTRQHYMNLIRGTPEKFEVDK